MFVELVLDDVKRFDLFVSAIDEAAHEKPDDGAAPQQDGRGS